MKRALVAAVAAAAAALLLAPPPRGRFVQLAPGTVELHAEMVLGEGAEVRGAASGSVLRAAADFQGRALIVVRGNHVLLHDFAMDGNREKLESRLGLPAYVVPFARFTPSNGVLAEGVGHLAIQNDNPHTIDCDVHRRVRRAGEPVAVRRNRWCAGCR